LFKLHALTITTELDETKFKLNIYPYTVESETELNYMGLTLQIAYPDTYPDVAPEINIFSLKGLTKKDCDDLKGKLDELVCFIDLIYNNVARQMKILEL
jgi:hypothetical protein